MSRCPKEPQSTGRGPAIPAAQVKCVTCQKGQEGEDTLSSQGLLTLQKHPQGLPFATSPSGMAAPAKSALPLVLLTKPQETAAFPSDVLTKSCRHTDTQLPACSAAVQTWGGSQILH